MLRDRLVVGIRDSAMSQKLQMDPGLTLEKAMKTVRQSAAVSEQQCQLKQLKEGSKGNPIRSKRSELVDLRLVEEESLGTEISR